MPAVERVMSLSPRPRACTSGLRGQARLGIVEAPKRIETSLGAAGRQLTQSGTYSHASVDGTKPDWGTEGKALGEVYAV